MNSKQILFQKISSDWLKFFLIFLNYHLHRIGISTNYLFPFISFKRTDIPR